MHSSFRRLPQGAQVTLVLENGFEKKFRLRKSVPKKCSRPRQLCIVCLKVIHKNSKNFLTKICKDCYSPVGGDSK